MYQSSKEIKFGKGRYCVCVFTARILNYNAVIYRADSQNSGLRVVTTLMGLDVQGSVPHFKAVSSTGSNQHLIQRVPGNTSEGLKAATHLDLVSMVRMIGVMLPSFLMLSLSGHGYIRGNKMPTRCNRGFYLQILLLAQHVSGITMPIIRSSRVLYRGCCVWYFLLWFFK